MPYIIASETATIDAPAARVYAVFADYRTHHPNVLPKEHFPELVVEEGGYGAGTVFRATLSAFGAKNHYHMHVTEPEPGHKLVETDHTADVVTTFTITPTADPNRSTVTIETRFPQKPGLAGLFDRFGTPPIARMIYRKELRNVQQYVQHQAAAIGV